MLIVKQHSNTTTGESAIQFISKEDDFHSALDSFLPDSSILDDVGTITRPITVDKKTEKIVTPEYTIIKECSYRLCPTSPLNLAEFRREQMHHELNKRVFSAIVHGRPSARSGYQLLNELTDIIRRNIPLK